jgi:hypothetical protein
MTLYRLIQLLFMASKYSNDIKTAIIIVNYLIKTVPLLKYYRKRVQQTHMQIDYISEDDIIS